MTGKIVTETVAVFGYPKGDSKDTTRLSEKFTVPSSWVPSAFKSPL